MNQMQDFFIETEKDKQPTQPNSLVQNPYAGRIIHLDGEKQEAFPERPSLFDFSHEPLELFTNVLLFPEEQVPVVM
jgi:hypothetical protein